MAVDVAGKSTRQLIEERAKIVKQAQAYHAEHEASWNGEDEKAWNEMHSDAESIKDVIDRRSKLAAMMAAEAAGSDDGGRRGDGTIGAGMGDSPNERPDRERVGGRRTYDARQGRTSAGDPRYVQTPCGRRGSREYADAFAHYLSTGRACKGLDEVAGNSPDGVSQYMTLQSDDATRGGYLLAEEQFAAELLKEVDDLLFVRRRAKVHQVPEASSLGIRKRTARANTFAWSSELAVSAADTALKYGKKVLTPHHLTGAIKVSRDLARRSSLIVGEIRSELARDASEAMEDGYLLGTGDRQPLGVFVASSDGISTARDVATGSATGFTADGLIDTKYSLKAQYRRGQRGELSWLFHRDAIRRINKLVDQDGQYLFRVGVGFGADNQPAEDMLLGYPVDESERVPNTYTDQLYAGLLANWRYYEIADALDMEIQILVELNARTNEIEYIGRLKTDGMPTLEEAFARLKCGT